MSLTDKEGELVSVGASLAAGCKPCTNYHFRRVRAAGASDVEIAQAMSDAVSVRDSAQKIMETHGLKLLGAARKALGISDEDSADNGRGRDARTTRVTELVSIAAALAVNCTSNLNRHIETARTLGVSDPEIQTVLDKASFIKGKADSFCCKRI